MGRHRKPGDVYALPLPDGTWGFVRVLNDAVAVYRHRGSSADDLPPDEDYEFHVCVYRHVFRNWQFVEHRPFASEDEAWPPPFCWIDQITGRGSLYYRGEQRACTYDECKSLEILAVWEAEHLVDRMMGDSRWQDCMKKPRNCDV